MRARFPDDVFRSDRIDMTGRRYGHLVVLGYAGRRLVGRQRKLVVRVRCDCGEVLEMVAAALRNQNVRQCRACGVASAAKAQSVRLPDGRTLAQIADACGLKLDTVYHRFIRGWEHWRLGEVTQRKTRSAS